MDVWGPSLSACGPRIRMTCRKCPDRIGNYSRDRAIQTHGDITVEEFVRRVSSTCYYRQNSTNFGPCMATAKV